MSEYITYITHDYHKDSQGNLTSTIKRTYYRYIDSDGGVIMHNHDGPAYIVYDIDGNLTKEKWYHHGEVHRAGAPADIIYQYTNGVRSVSNEKWYHSGKMHRDDGAAYIEYEKDGAVSYQSWWRNDKRHRDGAPSIIDIDFSSSSSKERWHFDNKLHRVDGPAVVTRNTDTGFVHHECWYVNDELHREGGPAYIEYSISGSSIKERWYKHSIDITTELHECGYFTACKEVQQMIYSML